MGDTIIIRDGKVKEGMIFYEEWVIKKLESSVKDDDILVTFGQDSQNFSMLFSKCYCDKLKIGDVYSMMLQKRDSK